MIALEDKPNVEAPSGSYNYGRLNDNTGSNNGTPVNRLVYNDMHEFFESLMAYAEIVPNGLPDSDDDGYQLIAAHIASVKRAAQPLLKMVAESIIGNPLSVTSLTAPGALLGIEWNAGFTVLSAGYIIWDEELFFCGGYTGAIVDTAVFTKVAANVMVVTDAVSGSGDFDFADLVRPDSVRNPNALLKKVVAIGNWDMDATTSVNVPHGLTDHKKIVSIQVTILSDNSALLSELSTNIDNTTVAGGGYFADATNIQLYRIVGGYYDQVAYDTAVFNRGYVMIEYLP